MKRDKQPATEPTEAEWHLLEVLWAHEPKTAREIGELLEDSQGWAYSTVKTMLDRMVIKRLARARRVGNVYEYSSGLPKEQAARRSFQTFVKRAFGGATLPALRFIARDSGLTDKQREELRELLDQGDE